MGLLTLNAGNTITGGCWCQWVTYTVVQHLEPPQTRKQTCLEPMVHPQRPKGDGRRRTNPPEGVERGGRSQGACQRRRSDLVVPGPSGATLWTCGATERLFASPGFSLVGLGACMVVLWFSFHTLLDFWYLLEKKLLTPC